MKVKSLFILVVLVLLIGCQADDSEDKDVVMEKEDGTDKEVKDESSEFYDDLDTASTELDELEES